MGEAVAVRFADGKVAEIRGRSLEADAKSHLAAPRPTRRLGAGEEVAAEWAELWADQPGGGRRDALCGYDRTDTDVPARLRRQRGRRGGERGGAEGVAVVPAGPGRRSASGRRGSSSWRRSAAGDESGDAVVFRQPERLAYEMALAWFEGDKATRVVACTRRSRRRRASRR